MSLDSRDKRSSALLVGLGFGRVLPNPDGTWNQGDRQQVGLSYRGILASALNVVAGPFYVVASDVYCGGAVSFQAYAGGALASEHHAGGAITSQHE